ncbi:tripartite tricarboxylate transporter TctB family protein [bacterium 1xD42-67]|nr:tripartite tricarboxylate transporter TctB family protein [bacterium 1xD42-67]
MTGTGSRATPPTGSSLVRSDTSDIPAPQGGGPRRIGGGPMKEKRETILMGVFFLASSALLFVSAMSIPAPNALTKGGDYMPKVMAVFLAVCSLGFLVTGIMKEPDQTGSGKAEAGQEMGKKQWFLFAVELALLFSYLYLLKTVGFLIMTSAYIFVQAWVITVKEERRPVKMAVIAVVSTVIIYLTFVKGFKLLLPAGILG